jgi:transcriptional regulator with XRE-family HTH domain
MQLDWFQLFDELKRRRHFGSDAQLADSLGLTRSRISAWRKNKSDLGTPTKFNILDALGHDTLRLAILSLLPEKNRQELIKLQEQPVARVNRCGQLFELTVRDPSPQRDRVGIFQHSDSGYRRRPSIFTKCIAV